MHGIVHKTLKEYVVEQANEDSWNAVLERAGIESRLYLPISYYPDEEIGTIIETLSSLSGHDITVIERDFGRTLAPELMQTFRAHVRGNDDIFELYGRLEDIYDQLHEDDERTTELTYSREDDAAAIRYRSSLDHPALIHGIIEGMATEFGADVTVERVNEEVVDGQTEYTFRLTHAE